MQKSVNRSQAGSNRAQGERTGKTFGERLLDGLSRPVFLLASFAFEKATARVINEIIRARKDELDPAIAYFRRELRHGQKNGGVA